MSELADQQAAEHQEPIADAIVQDTPAEPEKPLSIREGIEAAVKEARARDEKTGQFVKQDKPIEAAPEKAAPEPKSEAQPKEPSAPASTLRAPPPGWSKESKDFYNSLPPDHPLRKDVEKREDEVSNGFKTYGDKTKRFEEIESVLSPHRAGYQQHGLNDAQAINSLFAWENSFRNPATRAIAFQNLARAWNFDLSTLAQPSQPAQGDTGQQPPQQPVADPRIDTVVQELNEIRAGQMQREIASFSQGKPHFEAVRQIMGQLLNGGAAQTMDEAYQKALKLHPEVSALIEKEASEKAEAERRKQAEDKARQASLAASSVRGNATAGNVNTSGKARSTKQSVRESLMEAVKESRA
jgi:hypothetical protein